MVDGAIFCLLSFLQMEMADKMMFTAANKALTGLWQSLHYGEAMGSNGKPLIHSC